MNLNQFNQYLIEHEYIYPEYCIIEDITYKDYVVYSPQFGDKDIGLPIFYLVDDKDNIRKCNRKEMYEILDLLNKGGE